MTAVSVDRIALHVPAMSEDDARRLAELVAHALGRLPDSAPRRVEKVTAKVDAQSTNEVLAEQIAAAVLRELA